MLESVTYIGTPVRSWGVGKAIPMVPRKDGTWYVEHTVGPLKFTMLKKDKEKHPNPKKVTQAFIQRNQWRTLVSVKLSPKNWSKPSKDVKHFGRTWTYYRFGPVTLIRRSRPRDFDASTATVQTYEKFLLAGLVVFYVWLLSGVFL